MKKIFYWSPHTSHVATIKNVINSAISIKKFSKDEINVSILDVAGGVFEVLATPTTLNCLARKR